MRKKLVFDMDGTLLNSMGMWKNVPSDIERYRPIINELEPIVSEKGSMLNYSYKLIYKKFMYHERNRILALLDKYFIEFYGSGKVLKNNVSEVLDKLHEMGHEMYLATATDYKYALMGMQSHGLDKYLKKIYTPDTVKFRKNDIRYFQNIIKDLEVSPSEIVFFDDVLYALKLAEKSGFTTVAVEDEHAKDIDQIKNISDYYIKDFSEILENLDILK